MVVVLGMNTLDCLGQNGDYIAIALHIVVIGGLAKAGFASRNETLNRERLVAATARAVNDEELHGLVLKRLQILIHFRKFFSNFASYFDHEFFSTTDFTDYTDFSDYILVAKATIICKLSILTCCV